MKIDTQQNCEGPIFLPTGIIISGYNPRRLTTVLHLLIKTQNFKKYLKAISKGIAMTDRQYSLVLEKLENYRDPLKS